MNIGYLGFNTYMSIRYDIEENDINIKGSDISGIKYIHICLADGNKNFYPEYLKISGYEPIKNINLSNNLPIINDEQLNKILARYRVGKYDGPYLCNMNALN